MVINPLTFLFEFLINMVNLSTELFDFLMSDLPFSFFGIDTYYQLFFGVGLIFVLGVLVVKAIL
jgi:hypothetical protein